MNLPQPIIDRVKLLEEKYTAMGQDLISYLDGLLYTDVCTYWDYIHIDTLLSLQQPRTKFPDEEVFIMYHQVTELYFKLALHELQQIVDKGCYIYGYPTSTCESIFRSAHQFVRYYGRWNGTRAVPKIQNEFIAC